MMESPIELHKYFMRRAINLAKKAGRGVVPNPKVGAVLVKDDTIIGCGYHKIAGGPHAEIEAINSAVKSTDGSSIYITLEPCSTYGKTPPCVEALIKAGIKNVIIGTLDPNPLHNGKGIELLKEHGVNVISGVLQKECDGLIEDFSKYITTGLPFVISKSAVCADGKIASSNGDSKWVSSDVSRKKVQDIRCSVDAIMVGVNTVIKDNPSLTLRMNNKIYGNLWRIIIDPEFIIPEQSIILNDDYLTRTVVLVDDKINLNNNKSSYLMKKGIRIIGIKSDNNVFHPENILRAVAELPVLSLLIEGGGATLGHFFDFKCIDKMFFFIAPKIIGDKDAPGPFEGHGVKLMKDAVILKNITWKRYGDDMMLSGYPIWGKG